MREGRRRQAERQYGTAINQSEFEIMRIFGMDVSESVFWSKRGSNDHSKEGKSLFEELQRDREDFDKGQERKKTVDWTEKIQF